MAGADPVRLPYPLQWPEGWARTAPQDRERGRFQVGLANALDDLLHELDLLGDASRVVITSDLPTSERTGLPYANGRAEDPGIAVWCVIGGHERVFACDRWTLPAANIRAIGNTIAALRGISRWGAATMVNRAFQGFAALPPAPNPASTKMDWKDVLGLAPIDRDLLKRGTPEGRKFILEIARANHRDAIKIAHPDLGGTTAAAVELNVALQEAEAECGS